MSKQLRFPFADLPEAVDYSIALIRKYGAQYAGGFSGGKDSVVIKQLCVEAGVEVAWSYGVTTIDPPEVMRFVAERHPDVKFVRSKKYNNFAAFIAKRGFPTRLVRCCCREFKENIPSNGRITILGIRAEESPRRRMSWREWNPKSKSLCPILFWSEADVWEFIEDRKLPYCSLYDEGYARLGCVACPMANPEAKRRDLNRWPHVERELRKGFKIFWDRKHASWLKNYERFTSSDDLFDWWLSGKSLVDRTDAQC